VAGYFRRVRNFDIVYTAAVWLSPAAFYTPHWLTCRQDGTVDDELTSTVKT